MIAGRYTLEREIGRGGTGAVHLGRDEVLGRPVALKRIGMLPGADAPDLARAEREARLAAKLNHQHVVAVYDLVVEDDHQWLVMEYVEGETLSERIRRLGKLDHADAASLMWQAADALAEAHAHDIVHRDVKPSNILVTGTDQAKLTDFGIARAQADPSLTQTGLVTGSPAYLAPEVASGSTATAASDVWSLGASLYHALAGRPPYDVGENLIGALYKIVNEDPPRLPDAGPMATVLEHTMVRDPQQRWTMAQVRDHLDSLRRGETPTQVVPVPVPPPVEAADRTAEQPAEPPVEQAAPRTETIRPVPTPASARPRRRSWLPWLVGAAAVLLVGVVLVALLQGDDEQQPTAGTDDETTSQSPSPSPSETTDQPSEESPTEEATQPATRREMTRFITDYLSTVTSDPEATYAMLTPEFQEASNGFDGYSGFWGTVESATPRDVQADPESLTVTYTVDYVMQNGQEQSDDVSLQLVRQDDTYLIAGEA
ncbi:serine/threonine-protein kinase [Nocardioides sediminis]|uniref:serine/threonine-protein kinase n=1 Tax=Nocardioides sediminis TaxID=433648 RepID=UPI00131F2A1C|nr:serine/threonine-protein kinase [Nocardioides sediminis]